MSALDYKLFPRSEYELRWKRAKALMDRENLDALFITEPLNYHYFTGASPSFSRAQIYLGRK
jgi:Xaa-Pro aminopeptidase